MTNDSVERAVGAEDASKPGADVGAGMDERGAVGFTPGPWVKDGNGLLRGADGRIVGEWNSGAAGLQRSAESEANGILRNAAPELYAALVACKKVLDTLTEPAAINATKPEHVWAQAMEAEYKARKALLKATPASQESSAPASSPVPEVTGA